MLSRGRILAQAPKLRLPLLGARQTRGFAGRPKPSSAADTGNGAASGGRRSTRPDGDAGAGPGQLPLWFRERAAAWKKFTSQAKNRRRLAIGGVVFYAVVGLATVRYLRDTKHKATGGPNPYKQAEAIDSAHETPKIVPAHDTTPVYDGLAKDYDSKIWLEEITSYIWWLRRKLMKEVRGDALEVSCGTGRNVPWLKKGQVSSLTLVDSSEPMLEIAKEKFEKKFPDFDRVQFVHGHAEGMAAMAAKSGQKFDTVYESFGLCSHEDPDQALQNMRQLVRPGGRIVLLEHGRWPYDFLNEGLDAKAPQRAKEWGCRWNLPIDEIVERSGLHIEDSKRYHFGTIYFYILSVPKEDKALVSAPAALPAANSTPAA